MAIPILMVSLRSGEPLAPGLRELAPIDDFVASNSEGKKAALRARCLFLVFVEYGFTVE